MWRWKIVQKASCYAAFAWTFLHMLGFTGLITYHYDTNIGMCVTLNAILYGIGWGCTEGYKLVKKVYDSRPKYVDPRDLREWFK